MLKNIITLCCVLCVRLYAYEPQLIDNKKCDIILIGKATEIVRVKYNNKNPMYYRDNDQIKKIGYVEDTYYRKIEIIFSNSEEVEGSVFMYIGSDTPKKGNQLFHGSEGLWVKNSFEYPEIKTGLTYLFCLKESEVIENSTAHKVLKKKQIYSLLNGFHSAFLLNSFNNGELNVQKYLSKLKLSEPFLFKKLMGILSLDYNSVLMKQENTPKKPTPKTTPSQTPFHHLKNKRFKGDIVPVPLQNETSPQPTISP